jgi:hypothetical protein
MFRSGKLIFLLTFFALLVQSLVFFYEKPDELMAIPLALLLGGAGAFFIGRNIDDEDGDFQVNIFLLAFSVRLWAGIVIYGWDLTAIVGDEDASGYMLGWQAASNWYKGGIDAFVSDLSMVFFEKANLGQGIIWGIPMFIAGGPSRMIVSVINSFAGSMLVIVIFRIARRIFGSEMARIAAVLVAFWASIILLSAGTLKEMLVILFEWSLLYIAIRNPNGLTPKDGLLAIPAFLALYITRFYALYMVAAAYLFRVIFSGRKNLVRNGILGAIFVGFVIAFLGFGGVIDRDFERLDRQNRIIDNWRINMAEQTGSGTDIYSEYESGSVAIPVASIYFLFAPFPWEVFSGTPRNGFAAVENILIVAILIVGFPALKIFFKDKFVEMAPIFVFCILYAGLHIWGLANVGLAWRHKQTIMPLLFMLVALGITQRKVGWRLLSSRFSRKAKKLSAVPSLR